MRDFVISKEETHTEKNWFVSITNDVCPLNAIVPKMYLQVEKEMLMALKSKDTTLALPIPDQLLENWMQTLPMLTEFYMEKFIPFLIRKEETQELTQEELEWLRFDPLVSDLTVQMLESMREAWQMIHNVRVKMQPLLPKKDPKEPRITEDEFWDQWYRLAETSIQEWYICVLNTWWQACQIMYDFGFTEYSKTRLQDMKLLSFQDYTLDARQFLMNQVTVMGDFVEHSRVLWFTYDRKMVGESFEEHIFGVLKELSFLRHCLRHLELPRETKEEKHFQVYIEETGRLLHGLFEDAEFLAQIIAEEADERQKRFKQKETYERLLLCEQNVHATIEYYLALRWYIQTQKDRQFVGFLELLESKIRVIGAAINRVEASLLRHTCQQAVQEWGQLLPTKVGSLQKLPL